MRVPSGGLPPYSIDGQSSGVGAKVCSVSASRSHAAHHDHEVEEEDQAHERRTERGEHPAAEATLVRARAREGSEAAVERRVEDLITAGQAIDAVEEAGEHRGD